jgi:hypothetical protein
MSALPYDHRIEHTDQLPCNLDQGDAGMWFTDGATKYTWDGSVFVLSKWVGKR